MTYGIEYLNPDTDLWEPLEDYRFANRRTAAFLMIELNSRVLVGMRFRVTIIENAD